jgi:peroxiredoxin Q/BCP
MKLSVGQKAPEFSLPDQDGKIHKLSDYKGKWVLVYFYPKDDTPVYCGGVFFA